MYSKINGDILIKLKEIVGEDHVLTSADDVEAYAHDEVHELRAAPEAVAYPQNTGEVSEIMRLATAECFPVTPRGAGMGLSGGSVPICGGLVLSLEKMNAIRQIDTENLMVVVEPGVLTGNLQREVEALGLFYPPDPASQDSCSIGGNIAENAGGPRAIKYGVTRQYVTGLEAVLPNGEIIRCGGKLMKNVTGYDLLQLLAGSEGTLAVITEITLRLIPLPSERIDLLVPFEDFDKAAVTVAEIIKSRIVPAALEFMGRDSILAVEKLQEKEVPYHEAAAHLLITLDGNDPHVIESDSEKIGEICLENGAVDVLVADSEALRDKLWGARRLIIEALQNLSPERIMETQDIVVPRNALPEILKKIRGIGDVRIMKIISFGHSGDGNVHVNIIKQGPEPGWRDKVSKATKEIYQAALDLGGAITGEHGVGVSRRPYLEMAVGNEQIRLMKGIKDTFDPDHILNPGKIFL